MPNQRHCRVCRRPDRWHGYRNIFYDLSRLLKDSPYLKRLQEKGRQVVRENYDLRVIAEQTINIYTRADQRFVP
ncbi:MAG TPA: hypothetical protein VJ036_06670 [bacterium]|nr:hypothetical protein [bacterium]